MHSITFAQFYNCFTQPVITCSKLTIETLEQGVKYLPIKTPKRRLGRHSGVVNVNFEHILLLTLFNMFLLLTLSRLGSSWYLNYKNIVYNEFYIFMRQKIRSSHLRCFQHSCFSYEICEIFKNTYLEEHLQTTASKRCKNLKLRSCW